MISFVFERYESHLKTMQNNVYKKVAAIQRQILTSANHQAILEKLPVAASHTAAFVLPGDDGMSNAAPAHKGHSAVGGNKKPNLKIPYYQGPTVLPHPNLNENLVNNVIHTF